MRIPRNEPKILNSVSVFKDCIKIKYRAETLYITKLESFCEFLKYY